MDDATRPLYAQTQAVLSALDRGHAAALAPLTTEDITLVDTDVAGRPALLHGREALREYLARHAGESHTSTILAYDGHPDHETGWSVVRFQRTAAREGEREPRREFCSATLLWRLTPDGWKLTRWHCSILRVDVTAGQDGPTPS